ncbi:MAG: sel1 repeat family protein [Alphaproteobacteria bacterium]|nr:sel1 repeat family protein [Alphaproteobacteria bacterium]
MKKLLLILLAFCSVSARAQNIFWSFNDEQQPMTIAPECDARFDEVRGGVFMPSLEDVFQYGTIFLENQSPEIKRQAPYCFLVAALGGNADAQFILAQLYNKGEILPQDDLSAYKWAFIAALNGNKEAEKFTLNLEQFLTTEDLEATSSAIQTARLQIQENMQKQLAALKAETTPVAPIVSQPNGPASNPVVEPGDDETVISSQNGRLAPLPTALTKIFSEEDRF